MRTMKLLTIVLLLNACDSNLVTGIHEKEDVNAEIEILQKEAKEHLATKRDEFLQRFEPEQLAKELFDFSQLECEKNGVCKVKISGSNDYTYFSVSNLISQRADYMKLIEFMNYTRRNGKLATALREGGQEIMNDKNAMLEAATEDSAHIRMTINLFEDLQDYYREKTLQLNK